MVFSPDGDGRADKVKASYRVSEAASVLVLVDGRKAVEGRVARSGKLEWYGKRDRRPLPPGLYAVTLVARDPAGNRSQPTPTAVVRVRYIALARSRLRVPAGVRFGDKLVELVGFKKVLTGRRQADALEVLLGVRRRGRRRRRLGELVARACLRGVKSVGHFAPVEVGVAVGVLIKRVGSIDRLEVVGEAVLVAVRLREREERRRGRSSAQERDLALRGWVFSSRRRR
jgi:hypothetical protein